MSRHPGIERREQSNGAISWRAVVKDKRTGKRSRRTFASLSEAQAWRQSAQIALRDGTHTISARESLADAAGGFLTDCTNGVALTRGGRRYKPSAIRTMEANLRLRVLPQLGHMRFTDVTRRDVQALVHRLIADGVPAATIQTTLLPLQVMYRRALQHGIVAINPTTSIEKPAVKSRRETVASVTEIDTLLAALEPADRRVWATALWAGLRRGEMFALKCCDVNLGAGEITISRGWDGVEGEITPKNDKPRTVPLPPELRDHIASQLLDHRTVDGAVPADAHVFGKRQVLGAYSRAHAAWAAADLKPIDYHTARHTYASTMIAAGVNAKALCEFMGHSSIKVTFDLYGHLFPGQRDEAAKLQAAYLAAERQRVRTDGATMLPAGFTAS
jgi:integrase